MIFAHEPRKIKLDDGSTSHSVCTVFKNKNKTISIALDNSCGRLSKLIRSDLCLLAEDAEGIIQEVTHRTFGDSRQVDANLENFQKAWEWLNESGRSC